LVFGTLVGHYRDANDPVMETYFFRIHYNCAAILMLAQAIPVVFFTRQFSLAMKLGTVELDQSSYVVKAHVEKVGSFCKRLTLEGTDLILSFPCLLILLFCILWWLTQTVWILYLIIVALTAYGVIFFITGNVYQLFYTNGLSQTISALTSLTIPCAIAAVAVVIILLWVLLSRTNKQTTKTNKQRVIQISCFSLQ